MARLVPAVALVLLTSTSALADDVLSVAASAPGARDATALEGGVFGGGFISNYYHQFYDIKIVNRPELDRVNPELGVRVAYSLMSWLGVEGEGSWMVAHTKPGDSASIFSARLQAVFQYRSLPIPVIPFIGAGIGLMHVSSSDQVLGSDTDYPIHIGGGAKYFVTNSIAVRADFRFLRGPSQQAPYTLNASYGEVMVGVSFIPSFGGGSTSVIGDRRRRTSDLDGDGIADAVDKCPGEPEDHDLYDDSDGCPDPDNDGDGIADAHDACPLEPEDKDGYQDDDGCPDKDNDSDGVADAQDKCPNDPEDKDGFQDLDGCPDPDNDGDGVVDSQDKCPNEKETINGNNDNDGCPDRGDAQVVVIPDRLEVLDKIVFNGTKLAKSNANLLGQISATLRAHPEILRLRVTVYVQPTTNADKDQLLSDGRAKALRDWLVEAGVASGRLEARGFGGTKPLVPPEQRGAAAFNERVDLIILDRK